MTKYNILIVGGDLNVGGDTLSTVRLAVELSRRGYKIFYMSINGPLLEEFRGTQIIHIENCSAGGHTPQAIINGAIQICKFLNRNKIDIIHIQTAPSIIMAYLARIFTLKCKPVIIWHNRGVRKLTYLLGTRVFINPLVDFVISISNYERNKLIRYGMNPQKVKVVYHGAYLCHSGQTKRRDIRSQYNIDSDSSLIGMIARLDPWKGHKYFIEAASKVLMESPQARFIVVGDGTLMPKLKALTVRLGIEKEVIFTGTLTDMVNVYSAIDIIVHPSLWESLCNVLLEALTFGKTIIATNGSVIPEIIKDGVDGLLVPPKNSLEIADKILYLLKNKDVAKKMSQAAKEKAEALFNVEKQVGEIEHIYFSLIQKKRC